MGSGRGGRDALKYKQQVPTPAASFEGAAWIEADRVKWLEVGN